VPKADKKPVVLISLYHYDSFSVRMLYSYLKSKNIPVYFLGFKRMKQKPTRTLKNDYVELHDYHDDVTEQDIIALIDTLKELDPALIGISLQSSHLQLARILTQKIRSSLSAPVLWGGSHPSIDPESCIKETDIVCVGEGFDPLVEVYNSISSNKDYCDIKNIWINRNGNVKRNDLRPLMKDIDVLPHPSFSPEHKIYIDEGKVQKDKNIDYFGFGFTDEPLVTFHQTMTSFGCPLRCSFCINSLPYDRYRRRSPQNVIKELIHAKKVNESLKIVFFWDNILGVDKKWSFEFAELYKKEISLPFFAYSHPLFIDREIMKVLRQAGWSITVMGIQSGCERLRKDLYARKETNEQVMEATKRLNELRKIKSPRKYFRIYYDYVKNNPIEGKKDLTESLDLFLKFPKGFIFQAFNLSFFPNYPLTKYFLDHGLISEKHMEGGIGGTSAANWITTFDSKKKYRGFLRRHEYYYLLFSLAQYKSFPNFLIKYIEKKKLFMNRLVVLYTICRIVRFLELTLRISNYYWLWEVITIIPLKMKLKKRTLIRYE